MSDETRRLAEYAAEFRYEDLPAEVLQRVKDSISDGVAAVVFGYDLPWSQTIVDYARTTGQAGRSYILGLGGPALTAGQAAFANGALAHAFELDGGTTPNVGVHPCATIFPAALALAQQEGLGGKELIAAFAAATEVLFRIGRATKRTNEHRGFHGPGTTGPFGAAIAGGRLLRLDAKRLAHALGIAGSLCCGLVQFIRSGSGAMVKRLHLGRAAESGVLSAILASKDFTGPTDVLEGELGFLRAYCDEFDPRQLTYRLGTEFATLNIYIKRFACHGSAQNPLQALEYIREDHDFAATEIESIDVSGNAERIERNNNSNPQDIMVAQSSVPFCVALSCFRDARDPHSFDRTALEDPAIRSLAARVRFFVRSEHPERSADFTTVTVRLENGQVYSRDADTFRGAPDLPAERNDVYEKFSRLTSHCPKAKMDEIFERLQKLEVEKELGWLRV